jgi:hypothetical protein
MPKYEVVVQPSGLLNGSEWPAAGESIDLPEAVGDGMVESGDLKKASEKAPAKKAAAKPDKSEKATASKADEEKR